MGAPIGNCNAAKNKTACKAKKGRYGTNNNYGGLIRRPDYSLKTLKKAGFKKTKWKNIYIL